MTQRGNHRENVFFRPGDQAAYLGLLRDHAHENTIEVVAYCLMSNHIHLVVVPSNTGGLHRALKAVHGQYAQRINRMRDQKGHLWQGRYFSSALDSSYFLNAVRYVELNPVRAGIVKRAEDYEWSSAAAHCGVANDILVGPVIRWPIFAGIENWSNWLKLGLPDESVAILRSHGSQNLPCGAEEFVSQLEVSTGRRLMYCKHGGPRTPRRKKLAS